MLKWIGIILLPFLGLCTVGYLYGVALRNAGIAEGKWTLKMAAKDYAELGYVTNYGSRSYQVWLSTNTVAMDGTQYQCFITTTNLKFHGEGSLAMSTNSIFIWLDNKYPPKLIGTNYRAPIFPPRF